MKYRLVHEAWQPEKTCLLPLYSGKDGRSWRYVIQLHELQKRLHHIYDIDCPHNVEDFITHNTLLVECVTRQKNSTAVAEQLLLKQQPDGLDVSLFLDELLVKQLAMDNPLEQLHHGNIASFCTVLEGISHFLYLVWNIQQQRAISCFEMELQAEVDKYVMATSLLAEQSGGNIPRNLHRSLFEKARYHAHLSHAEYQRYYLANRYARHYCYNLHKQLMNTPDCVNLTREIRRFYRMMNQQKLARIKILPVLH